MRPFRSGVVFVLVSVVCVGLSYGEPPPSDPKALEAQWQQLTSQYTSLFQAGEIAKAIATGEQALKVAEQAFGLRDEHVAQVLNDVGYFYGQQHAWGPAEQAHQRALAIRDEVFHAEGPAVVQSLNNLAKLYETQERYAEAKPLFERSLKLLEHHVGTAHPMFLDTQTHYHHVQEAQARTNAQGGTKP